MPAEVLTAPGGGGGGSSLLAVTREYTEEELRSLATTRVFRGRRRSVRYWYELLPRPGVGKFYHVADILLDRGAGVAAASSSNFGPAGLFYSNEAENSEDNLRNGHSITTGGAVDRVTIALYLVSNLISVSAYKAVVVTDDVTVHEDTAVVFGMPSVANVVVGDITGTFKLTARYELRDT